MRRRGGGGGGGGEDGINTGEESAHCKECDTAGQEGR